MREGTESSILHRVNRNIVSFSARKTIKKYHSSSEGEKNDRRWSVPNVQGSADDHSTLFEIPELE